MRVLFATTRGAGHVGPLIPLATACLEAGHDVLVAGPEAAAPPVRRAGLPFSAVAEPPAAEVAAAWAPVWRVASQAPDADYVIRELFGRFAAGAALADMLALVERFRPDVIVRETLEFSSAVAAERHDVPQVRFGIHLAAQTDTDHRFVAMAAPALAELRERAGLDAEPAADAIVRSPVLTLAPRSADDPGVPEARGLHRFRVGEPPPAKLNGGPRLVYVSFGSEAGASGHFPRVYRAAADALGELPIRVLIAVGERQDPAALGPVPANVRVERWVDQAEVLSRASAMVGHGGSGSTLAALTAGVPQAFVPLFVDGPRNARRVAELGAGIALGGPDDIGSGLADAVRRLLHDPRPRQAAEAIAAEIRALPPIAEAVRGLAAIA